MPLLRLLPRNTWLWLPLSNGLSSTGAPHAAVTRQEQEQWCRGWGNVIKPTRCTDQGTSYCFTNLLLPHRLFFGGVCSWGMWGCIPKSPKWAPSEKWQQTGPLLPGLDTWGHQRARPSQRAHTPSGLNDTLTICFWSTAAWTRRDKVNVSAASRCLHPFLFHTRPLRRSSKLNTT